MPHEPEELAEEMTYGYRRRATMKVHIRLDCHAMKYARADDLIPVLFRDDDPTIDRSCSWCWPTETDP